MKTSGRLLVTYSGDSTHVTTTHEYLEAFARYSDWNVSYVNVTGGAELRFELNDFDAIVQSYSARPIFEDYVSTDYRRALRDFRGVRVLAVQDEYDRTYILRQAIRDDAFHIVLTCVPPNGIQRVYPPAMFPETEFISVLTGYVPDALVPQPRLPLDRRPIVIGYRGRDIGARYGQLGFDKFEIGRRMREICEAREIAHDIEWTEDKRIYGNAWYDFLRSCRVVLGSESGSNVFDFDGSIERRYRAFKEEGGLIDYENFRAFTDKEREIQMGQISPRVFEAAAQWTPMVLFTGTYSGAIRPEEHYIELKKDFSNVDEVLRRVEDLDALEAMATRAHEHLIASGAFGYPSFIQMVQGLIAEKHELLPSAGALREEAYPYRSEGHADLSDSFDLYGEYPTVAPKGIVYFHHRESVRVRRILETELNRCNTEMARMSTGYQEQINQLNTVYQTEINRLNAEIARLNMVYPEQIDRLNTVYETEINRLNAEIARLNTMYPEQINQLDTVYQAETKRGNAEIARLNTVYQEEIDRLKRACTAGIEQGNTRVSRLDTSYLGDIEPSTIVHSSEIGRIAQIIRPNTVYQAEIELLKGGFITIPARLVRAFLHPVASLRRVVSFMKR